MTALTLILLAAAATIPSVPMPARLPAWAPAVAAGVILSLAAVCGLATDPVEGVALASTYAVTVLVAAVGGSAVVPAVFALARRDGAPGPADEPGPLHGGRTIGVLERTAVAASILAGWPEGIAVVLAVKGLARYPELRQSDSPEQHPAPARTPTSASEQFIIGTFTSVMWAVAACGVGQALVT